MVDGCIRIVRRMEEVLTKYPETVGDRLQGICNNKIDRGKLGWHGCWDGFRKNILEPCWDSYGSSRGHGGRWSNGNRVCYVGWEWVGSSVLQISSWDMNVRIAEGRPRIRRNRNPLLPVFFLSTVEDQHGVGEKGVIPVQEDTFFFFWEDRPLPQSAASASPLRGSANAGMTSGAG